MKLGAIALLGLLFVFMSESQARFSGTEISKDQVVICGTEQTPCILLIPDVVGKYTLNKTGAGKYLVAGEFTWSNSADEEILAMVSHLELYFLLLSDKKVVHEITIPAPGKANKQVKFSYPFEFDKKFDSTTFIEFEAQGPE